MAEQSFFWDGTAIGDATLAPYDDGEFCGIFTGLLLNTNRQNDGIIDTEHPSYSGYLVLTKTGTTVHVATGAALVDGSLYTNSAQVNFACGVANNYYTIVIRKSWAAQTIRLALLGPNAVAPPAVTQVDGVTWEIAIGTIFNNAGTLERTEVDYQLGINPLMYRLGGSAIDFWNPGANAYQHRFGDLMFQFGSAEWVGGAANNGSLTVNFSQSYPSDQTPSATYERNFMVFVNCVDDVPYGAIGDISCVSGGGAPAGTDFRIEWRSIGGNNYTQLNFCWLAVGPRRLRIIG